MISGPIWAISSAHTVLTERRWTGADLASLIRRTYPRCNSVGQPA
ncbi:MAG: HWE histidine kinase domain-containing protein [Sphingomicrobium sp.]